VIDVEIKNFQAIDDLKLEVEGFTALVGRTNIGKSSIVRALKTALSGGSGSDFVRHDARACARILNGAKSCKCCSSVKVMFGEGQGFLWEKGAKGINRYTVWKDGVEVVYDRVGQSMDLPEVLGAEFAPVKLGPSQSLLQVTSQFEAPFLLDLSGGAVADVLSDIGQLDDINQAMAAVSKDRRSAIATRKVRESDVKVLVEQLVSYAALDDHLAKVEALGAHGGRVTEASGRLALLDRLLEAVTAATRGIRQLRAALEHSVPELDPVRGGLGAVGKVHAFQEAWISRSAETAGIERALRHELPDVKALSVKAERWRKARTWEAALAERERTVERMARVGHLAVPGVSWRSAFEALRQVSVWLGTLVALKAAFEKAARLQKVKVPDTAPVMSLCRRLLEAGRFAALMIRLEQEIESDAQQLRDCVEEMRCVLAEFRSLGICPTCHQDITPEHVVACAEG
jgi:hypothetical protein